jgi:'Cold-shock' DNA-binding domain
VKTAKDYRAMAEECAKWAREARDDDVSAPLLLFVHATALERAGMRGLVEGQKVSFDTELQ